MVCKSVYKSDGPLELSGVNWTRCCELRNYGFQLILVLALVHPFSYMFGS